MKQKATKFLMVTGLSRDRQHRFVSVAQERRLVRASTIFLKAYYLISLAGIVLIIGNGLGFVDRATAFTDGFILLVLPALAKIFFQNDFQLKNQQTQELSQAIRELTKYLKEERGKRD